MKCERMSKAEMFSNIHVVHKPQASNAPYYIIIIMHESSTAKDLSPNVWGQRMVLS